MNATNKQILIIGGIAAGAMVLYFFGRAIFSALKDFNKGTPYEGAGVLGTLGNAADKLSGGTLSAAGESLGETLFNWFGPATPAMDVYYTVTFPDGARHAIHAPDVDRNGYFTYGGVKYRMKDDIQGKHFAVKV